MDTNNSRYVMVPVPEERVPEVYAFLASAPVAAEPRSAEPQAEPNAAEAQAEVEWTDEEIKKAWSEEEIQEVYRETTDNVRHLLDYLAARPGQNIRIAELKAELGFTTAQFRGVTGGFGKRISHRHDQKKWFFRVEPHPDPEKPWTSYIMSEYVANVIGGAG